MTNYVSPYIEDALWRIRDSHSDTPSVQTRANHPSAIGHMPKVGEIVSDILPKAAIIR